MKNTNSSNNKYNIRAVRHELDNCIRFQHWNKFRARFESLNPDLQMAVVIASSKRASTSLLHNLCGRKHVPVEVFQCVLPACPESLFVTSPTPLSWLLNQTYPNRTIVERFLQLDTSKESLYKAHYRGRTPLLQAVRHPHAGLDVIRLLVEHNESGRTLWTGSIRHPHRGPLYYLVQEEWKQALTDRLSEELEYLLLETHLALERREATYPTETQEEAVASAVKEKASKEQHTLQLLHAMIACGQFMGETSAGGLVRFLIHQLLQEEEKQDRGMTIDKHDNSLLHHVCKATYSWTKPIAALLDQRGNDSSLLDFLISCNGQTLLLPNNQGNLPLHVALYVGKGLEFVQKLVQAAPTSVRVPTKDGRLPLHLAISQRKYWYEDKSTEDGPAIVKALFSLYPAAATVRDGLTHLFAFQLMALELSEQNAAAQPPRRTSLARSQPPSSKPNSSNREGQDTSSDPLVSASEGLRSHMREESLRQLDLIYCLLRSSPQVIKARASSSNCFDTSRCSTYEHDKERVRF